MPRIMSAEQWCHTSPARDYRHGEHNFDGRAHPMLCNIPDVLTCMHQLGVEAWSAGLLKTAPSWATSTFSRVISVSRVMAPHSQSSFHFCTWIIRIRDYSATSPLFCLQPTVNTAHPHVKASNPCIRIYLTGPRIRKKILVNQLI